MNTINKELASLLNKELHRQQNSIDLIASENYVSPAVLAVTGSVTTNKYAEGYPGKRYYGGTKYIDEIETLGINVAKKLFNAEYVNLQPHSGSQANEGAYRAVLNPADRVVAMSLNAGGHLTHGSKLNFSGKLYEFSFYEVDYETKQLDYEAIETLVLSVKPKLIVAGASAYSRVIDFKRFRKIADKVGAYLMVDMAHIAGLVAAGVHPSPFPYADIVTTTTHKTLRGARGGMIFAKSELGPKINAAIFPGIQGGPLENQIAGKTQALIEASTPEFKHYAHQIVKNAKALADELQKLGVEVLTGGTDNHMINIDVKSTFRITGRVAESLLEAVNIITNKELLPFDNESAFNTSGIRLGSPAMTTRGLKENDFRQIARWIVQVLKQPNEAEIESIKHSVAELLHNHPIYPHLKY